MTLQSTIGGPNVAMSLGESQEAEIVQEAQRKIHEHLTQSATFSRSEAYDGLVGIWMDCHEDNWDGYGATAIDRLTVDYARRLVDALPLGAPLPSLGADPDGDVTLEWHRDPSWTFSVSVNPEGKLHYAGLFDSDDPRGTATFTGQMPRTILHLIERVQRG